MENDKVWSEMAKAFKKTEGHLSMRMLAALDAAQAVKGDIRGKQSAAMIVVNGNPTGNIWEDKSIHFMIADHKEPLKELRRLLKINKAYKHMDKGDEALENNDLELAEKNYSTAEELYSENIEIKYWNAVSLANAGKLKEALSKFKYVFEKDINWWELTKRLPDNELLKVSKEDLRTILELIN